MHCYGRHCSECSSADLGPSNMRGGDVGGNEYAPHPVAGVAVIVPTAPAMHYQVMLQTT